MEKHIERWIKLIIGTLIAALGMALITSAGLGNVLLTVLWDGMSQKMPLSIGMASYMTSLIMILFSLLFDRSQIKVGTVVHFIVFGAFMDLFNTLIHDPETIISQYAFVIMGILLLSIGIGIYAHADLGRGPYEGICFAISDRLNVELRVVRTTLDTGFAVLGFVLGGAIGIATLLNLATSGWMIQKTLQFLSHREEPKAWGLRRRIQSRMVRG